MFLLVALSYFWLFDWLWSSNEEFLYKENVGFLVEMLSKFSQNLYFCFGHNIHSSKLSDSNLWVNYTSRRTNLSEISISIFGPHWTQKIHQSEALFSGQLWLSSDTVLVFRNNFGI